MFTLFLIIVVIGCFAVSYYAFKSKPDRVKSLSIINDRIAEVRRLKYEIDTANDGFEIVQLTKLRELEINQLMEVIMEKEKTWYFKFDYKLNLNPRQER